jgi:hypothetical protein
VFHENGEGERTEKKKNDAARKDITRHHQISLPPSSPLTENPFTQTATGKRRTTSQGKHHHHKPEKKNLEFSHTATKKKTKIKKTLKVKKNQI